MFVKYEHDNLNCFQQMLKKYNIDAQAVQIYHGQYSSQQSALFLPSIRLTLSSQNRYSTFILHGVMCTPDEFLINISLDQRHMTVNGVNIDCNGLNIFAPNETVYLTHMHDSTKEGLNIGFSVTSLARYVGSDVLESVLKNVSLIRSKPHISPVFVNIQKNMAIYVNNIFLNPLGYSEQALIDLEEALYTYIANLFSEICEQDTNYKTYFNKRLAVVNRAMAFVDGSSAIHITVPSILQHAFCSLRSLEYAFQDILGMSPKRYLILRRMTLIKAELLLNPEQKIKDIAGKYGIVNFGRFAQDFYQIFGQYPKGVTLQHRN